MSPSSGRVAWSARATAAAVLTLSWTFRQTVRPGLVVHRLVDPRHAPLVGLGDDREPLRQVHPPLRRRSARASPPGALAPGAFGFGFGLDDPPNRLPNMGPTSPLFSIRRRLEARLHRIVKDAGDAPTSDDGCLFRRIDQPRASARSTQHVQAPLQGPVVDREREPEMGVPAAEDLPRDDEQVPGRTASATNTVPEPLGALGKA